MFLFVLTPGEYTSPSRKEKKRDKKKRRKEKHAVREMSESELGSKGEHFLIPDLSVPTKSLDSQRSNQQSSPSVNDDQFRNVHLEGNFSSERNDKSKKTEHTSMSAHNSNHQSSNYRFTSLGYDNISPVDSIRDFSQQDSSKSNTEKVLNTESQTSHSEKNSNIIEQSNITSSPVDNLSSYKYNASTVSSFYNTSANDFGGSSPTIGSSAITSPSTYSSTSSPPSVCAAVTSTSVITTSVSTISATSTTTTTSASTSSTSGQEGTIENTSLEATAFKVSYI